MNNNTAQGSVISDKELTKRVTLLPNEISPERDLWAGIERAIQHKAQEPNEITQSNVFVPSVWAASILVVVLASWFTFSPTSDVSGETDLVQTNQTNESKQLVQGQLVNFMQQSFAQQKQTLLMSYGQPKLNKLSPAMQKELNQLSSARASIIKALQADENNADLLNLLEFTQQQELKLLQQLYRQYQVFST